MAHRSILKRLLASTACGLACAFLFVESAHGTLTRLVVNTIAGGSTDQVSDVRQERISLTGVPLEDGSESEISRILASGIVPLGWYCSSGSSWGRAEVGHLRLRARAVAGAGLYQGLVTGLGQANARPYWNDGFTIDGGPALFGQLGEMTFQLFVDGTLSMDAHASYPSSTALFRVSVVIQDSFGALTNLLGGMQIRVAQNGTLQTEAPAGGLLIAPGIWPITARFHFGRKCSVTIYAEANLSTETLNSVKGTTLYAESACDFSQSVRWGGISQIKVSGGEVVTNFTLASDSGYDYLVGTPGDASPSNDRFTNSILVGTNLTAIGSNVGATMEPGEPSLAGPPTTHSVWWHWVAPQSGDVLVTATSADFAPRLGVFTNGTPAIPASLMDLRPVHDLRDGVSTESLPGALHFYATQGETYLFLVDGVGGAVGPIQLRLETPLSRPIVLVNGLLPSTLSVTANDPPTIQFWSSSPGDTFFYTVDGTDPTGKPELYTGAFTVSQSVILRVIAYNSDFSLKMVANPLAIVLQGPPVIVTPPQNQVAVAGGNTQLSVRATGAPPLAYRWLTNGIALPAATNQDLFFGNVLPFQAGAYQAVVSNAFGSVTSIVANLSVHTRPAITTGPAGATVAAGASVTLSVVATADPPPAYQWRKNGATITDATNDTLTLPSVQFSDGATYTVVVANDVGSALSTPARLVVTVPSPPAQDNFANRFTLTNTPGSVTGSNVLASIEPGEPSLIAGRPGGSSVWYTWTAPSNGIALFRTTGSTFDTLLAIYTNSTLATLGRVASDDDAGGFLTSQVRFTAFSNTTYQIVVDGLSAAQGNFVLQWELAVTTATLPVVTSQPCDQVVLPNGFAEFTVTATSEPLAHQWFFNGAALRNATNVSYVLTNVLARDVGFYSVRLTNAAGQFVESRAATLEIDTLLGPPSGEKIEDQLLVSRCGAGNAFAPAAVASSVSAGMLGSFVVPASDTNNAACAGLDSCGGIPLGARFKAFYMADAGTCLVDAQSDASGVALWVCQRANAQSSFSFVTCAASEPGSNRVSTKFSVLGNRDYFVWFALLDRQSTNIAMTLRMGLPPVLIAASPSRIIAGGSDTSLTLMASNAYGRDVNLSNGLPAPEVHWFRAGLPLGSATERLTGVGLFTISNRLVLSSTQWPDAGTYTAVVSNLIGSTSTVVRLGIIDNNPVVRTDLAGQPSELIARVTTENACLASYQWRFNGTNLPLATNATLLVRSNDLRNAGAYSVVVSSCVGAVTGAVAQVRVQADLPIEPLSPGSPLWFRFVAEQPPTAVQVDRRFGRNTPDPWQSVLTTNLGRLIRLPVAADEPAAIYRGRLLP